MNDAANSPLLLVIFGISGDLAHRKLMPALTSLFANNHLPEKFTIVGISRKPEYTVDTLFADFKQYLPEWSHDADRIDELKSHCIMLTNEQASEDDFARMRTDLEDQSRSLGDNTLRMYYLSVPAQAFITTVHGLGATHHQDPFANESHRPRILVEKPFGYDSASAQELINATEETFRPSEIYRIDHYLAKETAQNLLIFRFHNPMFQSIWNSQYVDTITIGAYEHIGVEGRAGFYEKTGALRDLIQSHLLQLLSLVAMEHPNDLTSEEIHERKLELLRAISPVQPDQAVRGQYNGYRDEVHSPDSVVETFARLNLHISNERWDNTQFIIETGKSLSEKATYITLHFRESRERGGYNTLTFHLQPKEGITVTLQAKKPGLSSETETVDMTFDYADSFNAFVSEAYERVIIDAVRGDQTLFATSEEVMESWRVIEPLIEAWRQGGDGMVFYEQGTDPTAIN